MKLKAQRTTKMDPLRIPKRREARLFIALSLIIAAGAAGFSAYTLEQAAEGVHKSLGSGFKECKKNKKHEG